MAHLCPDPPPRGLRGKVAIVTGAGCAGEGIGNGRAMSIMLADEGCNIVCVDLQSSWVDKTCEMANAKAGRGKAVSRCADVTSADDCAAVVQFAMDEFGRLDILVNNVGVTGPGGTALDTDLEQWAPAFEVNVASMVKMAKFAIPAMMKNEGKENRGVIINMGSIAGLKGGTPDLLYPTSKGAVFNMTRAMAAHHARDGIRVNCVCPGALFTPMVYSGGMSEEMRESRRSKNLLGTEGTAWDCAGAAVFLASDHARWITGIMLPVDAGVTATVGIDMPSGKKGDD